MPNDHTDAQAPASVVAADGPWASGRRSLTAGLLLAATAGAFESLAVATALPRVAADLGGLALYGWAFGAFLLANLVVVAVAGDAIDRRGPFAAFAVGIALFVAGLLIAAFAPAMPVVVAARAVQGAGAGFLSAATYSAAGLCYPESVRPRALALLSAAWVVPALAGPALAGAIADLAGWRWVFAAVAPLALAAGLLAAPRLPRAGVRRDAGGGGERAVAALVLAAGTGLALSGLGRTGLVAAVLLAAGGALVAVAWPRLLPPGVLRARPGLPAAVATMLALSAAFYGAEAYLPLVLQEVLGRSTAASGMVLTASAVAWPAGAWVFGRQGERWGTRGAAGLGFALIALGLAGVAAAVATGSHVVVVAACWAVGGLGVGLAYPAAQLAGLATGSADSTGRAVSDLLVAHLVGITLATGVGGVFAAAGSAAGRPSIIGLAIHAASMFAIAVLGLIAARRLPAAAPLEPVPL